MTTRVLGVDPSLTGTGLCAVSFAADPPSPSLPLLDAAEHFVEVRTLSTFKPKEKTKREYSRRVTRVVDQVEEALTCVDLVAMENLAFSAKGEAIWVLPWIFGRIIDLCERYDKQLVIVGTAQVKKYTTGKGNCKKEEAVLATVRRFPHVQITNNNEADALVCAAVGCRHLGLLIDSVPKANYVDVMKKLSA